MRAKVAVASALACVFLGLAGCSSGPEAQTQSQADAPQACREALTIADEVFGLSAQMAGAMEQLIYVSGDAIEAAFYRDAAGIASATDRLTAVNDQMTNINRQMSPLPAQYNAAKAACLE